MRFSSQEQMFFAQRLAFLIEGGMPLADALGVMRRQVRSRSGQRVAEALRKHVAAGHSLADGMRKFPAAFGTEAVTLVTVGESCGMLGRNLQQLADELKKRLRLRRKIVGALTYPAVVLAATCGIVAYLTTSLVPKLVPVFGSMHARLPASTRAVVAFSGFMTAHGLLIAAGAACFGIGCASAFRRDARLRNRCEFVLLQVPGIGSLLRHASLAHMSRAIGILLSGGLTLRDSCLACSASAGGLYDAHVRAMAEAINRGSQLSSYLALSPVLFPELFTQMVAAGEQSGKLPEALLYLSDHHEREVEEAAEKLSVLLEPALMLLCGGMVGCIAIAVISPMYALTQSLHA